MSDPPSQTLRRGRHGDKAAKGRRSSAAEAGETNSYANSRGRQVVSAMALITFGQEP
jgi:hypothetical protein